MVQCYMHVRTIFVDKIISSGLKPMCVQYPSIIITRVHNICMGESV